MLKVFLIIATFYSLSARGQELEVQVNAHYPASAFVTKRLLPFELKSATKFKLYQVQLDSAPSCSWLIDPFIDTVFHVYCRQPEKPKVTIFLFNESGKMQSIDLGVIDVAVSREPLEVLHQETADENAANEESEGGEE